MGTAQAVLSKCQHCKEHGTDFCYDCKKVLCGTCRTDHDKHTNINNHYVVPLRYVNNQILKTNLNCDKHDKKFELFCKTCDILVCSECVIASHPQHEFCCLSSTVKEAEKDLTALHTKLQEKRNILSSLITKIKSDLIPNLQKEKEAIRQNMINTVCTLQAAIDNVKVIEEERNDESYTAEEDRLNTTTKDVERLCNIYDSAIDVFKEASNEKHPVAFFMVYKSVKNNVHSLEEIIDTVEDGHIPAFDNTEFTHKVINTMLLNLNESCDWKSGEKGIRFACKLQDRDNTIKKLKATKEKLTKEVERMELEMKRTKLENEKTIKELQQKYDRISSMELEMKKTKTEYEKTVKEMQQKNDKLLSMELEMKRSKTEHEKAIKELQQKNDKLLSMQLELKKTKTAHEKNMKEMQQKYDKLLSKLQERDDTIGKLKEQEDYLTKTDASLQNDREVIPKTIMELKQRSDQLEWTPTKATPKKTIKEMLRHSSKLQERDDTIGKLKEQEDYLTKTDASLQNDREVIPKTIMELKQRSDQLEWTPTKATPKKTIKEMLRHSSKLQERDDTIGKLKEQEDYLTKTDASLQNDREVIPKTIMELKQRSDQLEWTPTKATPKKTIKEMLRHSSKLQERDDTIGKLKEQEDYLTKTDASLQNDREVIPKTIMELKQRSDQLEWTPTKTTPKKTIKEMLRHSRKPLHDEYHSATDNSLSSDADTMPSIFGNNYLLPHTTPSLNGLPFFKADKLLKKTKR